MRNWSTRPSPKQTIRAKLLVIRLYHGLSNAAVVLLYLPFQNFSFNIPGWTVLLLRHIWKPSGQGMPLHRLGRLTKSVYYLLACSVVSWLLYWRGVKLCLIARDVNCWWLVPRAYYRFRLLWWFRLPWWCRLLWWEPWIAHFKENARSCRSRWL